MGFGPRYKQSKTEKKRLVSRSPGSLEGRRLVLVRSGARMRRERRGISVRNFVRADGSLLPFLSLSLQVGGPACLEKA